MLDRFVAPIAEEVSSPELPIPASRKLSNGIEVLILEQKGSSVLVLDLVLSSGRYQEAKPGLSYVTAKMLQEGAGAKTATEIAAAIDFHGSHLEISPSLDHVFIKLYCLKKFFANQVALLSELLSNPTFPESGYKKLQLIRQQQIRQQHAKTNAYAGLKLRECLFGGSHPYGRIIDVSDVQTTSLDEVQAYYQAGLIIDPKIFVSGSIDSAELDMLEAAFGSMESASVTSMKPPISAYPPGYTNIAREGSVQSSLRIGHATAPQSHPDIHKLSLTNELLGGYFGSRLMKNIREEKGLTYGISSNMVHLQQASYWVIGTDVLKEKAGEAISQIKKEIKTLQNTPPTVDELNSLKNYLKGRWLMSFDSTLNAMNMVMNNHLAGNTYKYWEEMYAAINSCTPEDINEMAQRHFDLDKLSIVVVG